MATTLRRSTTQLPTFPWNRVIPWVVPAGLILLWQILAQVGVINSRILEGV
jgi:sulfonate transport system permease protein